MRPGIFLVLFFILILIGCTPTNNVANKNISGIYSWHEFPETKSEVQVYFRNIILNEDSTFIYSCVEGTLRLKTKGTWHIVDNKVTLCTEKKSNIEGNLVQDTSAYFLKKVLVLRKNRLYDTQIKKGKGIRKNYYEKILPDNKPMGNWNCPTSKFQQNAPLTSLYVWLVHTAALQV